MEGTLSILDLKTGAELPPVNLPRSQEAQSEDGQKRIAPFIVGSASDCDLVVHQPQSAEPLRFTFTWHRMRCTWVLENVCTTTLWVEGQPLAQAMRMPLVVWEATIRAEGVVLKFRRTPARPHFKGKPVAELLLPTALMIGRGDVNKDGGDTPRLELDSDIRSISSSQAEIVRKGGALYLLNHNKTGRTIVNGDQNFDEHKLVLGDCIQIPDCDYYTFKFTGRSLRHIGSGGNLVGSQLTVDVPGARILHPVDLEVPKGGFLGIIGGSGQGKSTLMNSLCGIVPATSGTVTVNDVVLRSPREVARAGIGYVPQDDIVHSELTVEDALYYAARLRLKATLDQIKDVLDATMDVLRLTEHRKKRIVKLSGGQRKRVSIASELLTSPDFLFLDEPTSGLDPQTERNLMGELAVLAHRKRMGIACTTHVLQNCHVMTRLVFISRGRLIFHGSPVEAVRFFLLSGTPDGAAMNRSSTGTASSTAGGASTTSSTITIGDSHHELSEAEMLGKISRVYDIAQDITKPIPEQDKTSQDWEREYKASVFFRPPPPAATSPEKNAQPPPARRVGAFTSLYLLVSRQWKILVSSKLNYLFLAAQSVIIGLLIGWVDDDPVLQGFLSLIATLWFGCSNGAQQIVAELPIFRRERLAGLGIHTYLLSKFFFLTLITCIQAVALYSLVLASSHFFHDSREPGEEQVAADFTGKVPDKATREFRMAFFEKTWSSLAEGDDSHPGDNFTQPTDTQKPAPVETNDVPRPAASEGMNVDRPLTAEEKKQIDQAWEKNKKADDFDLTGNDSTPAPPPAATTIYINPSGLHVKDSEYLLLEKLAWFFRIRDNVENTLGYQPVKLARDEDPVLRRRLENGILSWKALLVNLIGLRLAALLAAALVGVGLGLAVSSLVKTPTQAMMWVPLILIPQILFGSFVVIVPDMDNAVLAFSRVLPSFNLQRIMDVALIYGRETPRMTNQTKIPAFFTPPEQDEKVKWTSRPPPLNERQTTYKKASDANKSWQNLVVNREVLGQREKEINSNEEVGQSSQSVDRKGQEKDTVERRDDVVLEKGRIYLDLSPANICGLVLASWAAGCYLVSCLALRVRQTGR